MRNFFHPVARMLNPARAASQVIGLSHPPYFEKTIEALRMLSCPRALVIRGVEGDRNFRSVTQPVSSNSGRTHHALYVST